MSTMGELFDEEEERLLAQVQADIAAESLRYANDPVYRAKVDARINEFINTVLEEDSEDSVEDDGE